MQKSSALVAVLVIGASSQAHAQREVPLVSGSAEYTSNAAVRDSDPEVSFSSIRWSIAGLVPIPVTRKTVIVLVPGYRGWRYSSSEASDINVHDLGVLSSVGRQLTSRWAIAGTLGVGLATDFDEVDSDHIRVTGGITGELKVSPNLSVGLGVVGSYVFGKLLPVPIVSVDWLPSKRIYVFALAPQRVRVGFRATPKFDISLATSIDGNQFSAKTESPVVDHINISRGTLRAQLSIRAIGNVWLSAYAGRTLFRTLKAFDESDNELADLSLEQSSVFGLTAQFRIPVPAIRDD